MIHDDLLLQKRELERTLAKTFVERDIGSDVRDNGLVKVVQGPRRAGKSFWAAHTLAKKGKPFGYVNFDHERLIDLENNDELVAALEAVYNKPEYVLLDEIQNLPRWELFVNRLQRQGYRLVITGSNSHLLSQELATHLTGRHEQVVLFPFSFKEFSRAKAVERTTLETAESLHQYVEQGGFPEPLFEDIDSAGYASTLLDSIVLKDIVRRHRIRAVAGIESLVQYLLSNVASEYSYQTLTTVTGVRSVHTVKRYMGNLEEAFLLFSVPRFSWKVREQVAFNKKVYSIDNSFALAKGFRIGGGVGPLCENLVAVALKRLELERKHKCFFWKNQQHEEVDFVLKEGGVVTQLLQVCWDPSNPKTREREIRALIKAAEELRCEKLTVLNAQEESEEVCSWFGKKATVRFVPLWKWLSGT